MILIKQDGILLRSWYDMIRMKAGVISLSFSLTRHEWFYFFCASAATCLSCAFFKVVDGLVVAEARLVLRELVVVVREPQVDAPGVHVHVRVRTPGKIERSHSAVVEVREPDPGVVGKKMQRRWSSFFGPQYAAAPESSSAAVRRPGDTVQQTMQIFQRERRSSRGAATIEEQCAAFAKLDALGRGGQAKKK